MVSNGPLHSTLIEDANVDDSVLNAVEWHEYSEAAVRRHQQLASLNQRLSRLLEFANDVVRPKHEHSSNPPSPSRNKGFVDESGISPNSRSRSRSNEALTADLFKTKNIEEEIEEKTRIFRNSVQLYDVRIDTVRRAMKAVSEKNEELTQENRELRILNSETEAEVQRLKDENEKLQKKNRELITRTPPTVDHRTCQESIKSLQLENRTLKGRLHQHKHLLRKGLDDFISRSIEALQNGTPHLTAYENHVFTSNTGDDDDKIAIRTEKSKSTVQSDVVPKEQVTQLEDELKTLTNELEYERFCSKRKINRLQEKLDQLSENLRRKEAELQKTFGELESALKTLQALIMAGDDTEKEVDTYRCLLEEAEFQLLESSDDSSGFSSSAPVCSFGSSYSSSEDETTESCNSLEIKRQDVRKGEYIVFQNKGEEPLDMSRWYIVQQCGNKKVTHQLPTPFIMKPKSRVVMWSADAKTSHISPVNYVMSETVLPWCESGEADLITKVYDLLGNVVSRRKTRIRGSRILDDPEDRAHPRDAHSCTLA